MSTTVNIPVSLHRRVAAKSNISLVVDHFDKARLGYDCVKKVEAMDLISKGTLSVNTTFDCSAGSAVLGFYRETPFPCLVASYVHSEASDDHPQEGDYFLIEANLEEEERWLIVEFTHEDICDMAAIGLGIMMPFTTVEPKEMVLSLIPDLEGTSREASTAAALH
ncbi:MAG: hypothetical protein V4731_06410 [Pseudomonadota bacterium]